MYEHIWGDRMVNFLGTTQFVAAVSKGRRRRQTVAALTGRRFDSLACRRIIPDANTVSNCSTDIVPVLFLSLDGAGVLGILVASKSCK